MTLFRLGLTALLLASVQAVTPDSVSSRLMVHVSEILLFWLHFGKRSRLLVLEGNRPNLRARSTETYEYHHLGTRCDDIFATADLSGHA
jgi:hypothetical protein